MNILLVFDPIQFFIAIYFLRLSGLTGENAKSDAVVDMLGDLFHEACSKIAAWSELATDGYKATNVSL